MQFRDPGEAIREAWERLKLPERMTTWEDVDDALSEIVKQHTRMQQAGFFKANDPTSCVREMQDLARKVPYGTPLRHFFAA